MKFKDMGIGINRFSEKCPGSSAYQHLRLDHVARMASPGSKNDGFAESRIWGI
jgi:hypothetical protein